MARQALRSEVRNKGQITIPLGVRQAIRLEEGDLVEFSLTRQGILIRPVRTIDPAQTWFWTKEWQEGEREASSDIRAKRLTHYKSGREFLSSLKK